MKTETLSTRQKALKINLDRRIYGSFAEIGAGQEVAAMFFKSGGASGTIAKTISAYDMTFSDAIYGVEESGRYVCEPRLIKMLNREYNLLHVRLGEKRGEDTTFFAFADTVSALNFQKTNEGHGWIGMRFQTEPFGEYNDLVLHIRMLDNDNVLQQQAIGTIGVNLIYACFYYYKSPELLLKSLMDDLTDRLEIDMLRVTGPDFKNVDNRLIALQLVRNGFTNAAMFGADGQVIQPSEVLYKKHIVAIRGRFRPFTHVNMDMLQKGIAHFLQEPDVNEEKVMVISELTLSNLTAGEDIDEKDFLDRVDILCSLGQTVMISNYQEYYKLAAFLSRFTKLKMGFLLGITNLQWIFEEK
ncbi:MAG: TonB-dependent receptor, partial [Verrucomicrobia bacterium]|nr:TonB-dependent receptor [Cytophagales bacterium]